MPGNRTLALLSRLRDYVSEQRDFILEGNCVIDRETGNPLPETLDEMAQPAVDEADALLAEIDAVLRAIEPAPLRVVS